MEIPGLVSLLMGLQYAAFGWRINREISVGDRGEQTWLPLADILNLSNFCLTIIFCILIPLKHDSFGNISKAFLASGLVLVFFHPINMLAHYELLDNKGRIKINNGKKNLILIIDLLPISRKNIHFYFGYAGNNVILFCFFSIRYRYQYNQETSNLF